MANHPFGVLEGLLLAAMLRSVRQDVRILTNSLLRPIRELDEICIWVNPFESSSARAANPRPLRQALRWLRRGGLLVVFPAGEVASFNWRRMAVVDPPWNDTASRLALRARAAVVPVCFRGRNRLRFQLAGMVHPRLRTALLPREFIAHRGKQVHFSVGRPVPPERTATLDSPAALTACIRQRVELLADRRARLNRRNLLSWRPRHRQRPVVAGVDPGYLQREISALPERQTLLDTRSWQVFFARAPQIPELLREIGRLREITFRAVGEGTGRQIDLDRFDPHYLHLCVWNRSDRRVAGAYRLGHTEEILPARGARGLYTSTLFELRPRLLEVLTPALELGRSFVTAEYQRSPALSMLWKGLGRYVLGLPRHRLLFGPVSITADYRRASREIMVRFLREHCCLPHLAPLIRARRGFRSRRFSGRDMEAACRLLSTIDDVSELVADIEADAKGVPVLLRQYLRLGGRLLDFNVDAGFGHALDGLVVVDLCLASRRILSRYLGTEGADRFLERHASNPGPLLPQA
jgi:putative hemolysin